MIVNVKKKSYNFEINIKSYSYQNEIDSNQCYSYPKVKNDIVIEFEKLIKVRDCIKSYLKVLNSKYKKGYGAHKKELQS